MPLIIVHASCLTPQHDVCPRWTFTYNGIGEMLRVLDATAPLFCDQTFSISSGDKPVDLIIISA
jgi:hypothetical protein